MGDVIDEERECIFEAFRSGDDVYTLYQYAMAPTTFGI